MNIASNSAFDPGLISSVATIPMAMVVFLKDGDSILAGRATASTVCFLIACLSQDDYIPWPKMRGACDEFSNK